MLLKWGKYKNLNQLKKKKQPFCLFPFQTLWNSIPIKQKFEVSVQNFEKETKKRQNNKKKNKKKQKKRNKKKKTKKKKKKKIALSYFFKKKNQKKNKC